MRKIEIKPLDNGAHRNQTGTFSVLPEGWAVIPDDMETPNLPFGEIEIEEIDGVMTVTKWTAGVMPETEEPENDMSKVDQLIETLYKTGKLTEEEYKQIVGGGK